MPRSLPGSNAGLTLVEVMVATAICLVLLGLVMESMVGLGRLVSINNDTATACNDLRNMVERIRGTTFDFMVSTFPNDLADGPTLTPYSGITGAYSLKSESIKVNYANPNTDPLEIKVTVSWQDAKNRTRSVSAVTFRTR